jgi:hypothetical protein
MKSVNTLCGQNAFTDCYSRCKAFRYTSEALRLCPQRYNTAKPTRFTTVFHRYSLTVARHATVVVAVPSTVHYSANYKIKVCY